MLICYSDNQCVNGGPIFDSFRNNRYEDFPYKSPITQTIFSTTINYSNYKVYLQIQENSS